MKMSFTDIKLLLLAIKSITIFNFNYDKPMTNSRH